MENDRMPGVVELSVVLLVLICLGGTINVASGLGHWFSREPGSFPIVFMGRAVIYCIVPMLAVADIVRRRESGRLLAILPLISIWAVFLRMTVDLISSPLYVRSASAISFFFLLAVVVTLPSLILSLGFGRRALSYFAPSGVAMGDANVWPLGPWVETHGYVQLSLRDKEFTSATP